MFRLEALSKPAEKRLDVVGRLLHVRGGAPRRGGRIVQLVRQTGGHGPQRNQLFPLLRVTFKIPHPI